MEGLNNKMYESHHKMENLMKEFSEHFQYIQKSIVTMVSLQNGHTATLEGRQQALLNLQQQLDKSKVVKYVPPPSIPQAFTLPKDPGMYPSQWNLETPMTNLALLHTYVNLKMIDITSSPAFSIWYHSAQVQSEESMEAVPSETIYD